jgi:hypothetical protein
LEQQVRLSGTNPNVNAEEEIIGKGFGRFFDFRDFYTIITSSLRKYLKKAIIKSNSFRRYNSDCECEAQAIYHSSAVDGSGVAAETEHLRKKQMCRQDPAVECTEVFVNGTICLPSELQFRLIQLN